MAQGPPRTVWQSTSCLRCTSHGEAFHTRVPTEPAGHFNLFRLCMDAPRPGPKPGTTEACPHWPAKCETRTQRSIHEEARERQEKEGHTGSSEGSKGSGIVNAVEHLSQCFLCAADPWRGHCTIAGLFSPSGSADVAFVGGLAGVRLGCTRTKINMSVLYPSLQAGPGVPTTTIASPIINIIKVPRKRGNGCTVRAWCNYPAFTAQLDPHRTCLVNHRNKTTHGARTVRPAPPNKSRSNTTSLYGGNPAAFIQTWFCSFVVYSLQQGFCRTLTRWSPQERALTLAQRA